MSVHRDVTISDKTRDDLANLRDWLKGARIPNWHAAVEDVVYRWDTNDATETTFDDEAA